MESSQVLRSLFKDPNRQILLLRPGCIIAGSVHVVFWLSSLSQAFGDQHFTKLSKSVGPRVKGVSERIQTHFVIRLSPRDIRGCLLLVDDDRREPFHDRREARIIAKRVP